MTATARWLTAVAGILAAAGLVAILFWSSTCAHPRPDPVQPGGRTVDAPPPAGADAGEARPGEAAPGGKTKMPAREHQLMSKIREQVDSRPAEALRLIQLAEQTFPTGRLADERALLKMRALVHQGEIAAARDEALLFYQRYPGSPYTPRVAQLTGVHPRPRPGPAPAPSP